MDLIEISEMAKSGWVVWLMILFVGIVFWAFRPKNKQRFEEDAKIIFKEDDNGGLNHGAK